MSEVEEAKKNSAKHQLWMLETLVAEGGSCSYGKLVEVGEEHQCDTVGAMLKILKRKKAIDFKGVFLMYPMHKDEIVTLKDETYIEKVKEAASD